MTSSAVSMLIALTPTPSTSTRGIQVVRSLGDINRLLTAQRLRDLLFHPGVGPRDSVFQRHLRLPLEDLPKAGVVGVAPADALRAGHVPFLDGDAGCVGHEIGQRIDADQAVLPEVDRLRVAGFHEASDPRDAVVDVAERAGLLAVSPDLDLSVAG